MGVRHRRSATARLVILAGLLVAGIWYLYRHYIALPPAPPPNVTHSSSFLSRTYHI